MRQIVDISPGQRERHLGHLGVLASLRVRGVAVFAKPVTAVTEADLRAWLIDWDRSLKTKANYHGLIHGVLAYAVKQGYLTANPAVGTAPKRSRVRQSRPELRYLTERELETAVRLARTFGPLTGLLTTRGSTGAVAALSPAATSSSRCSRRNRTCLPMRVHRSWPLRAASATHRVGTLR